MHHWLTYEFLAYETGSEHYVNRRRQLDERFIGYLEYEDDAETRPEPPVHGIPRPAWFRGVTTVGDVQLAVGGMRRR